MIEFSNKFLEKLNRKKDFRQGRGEIFEMAFSFDKLLASIKKPIDTAQSAFSLFTFA